MCSVLKRYRNNSPFIQIKTKSRAIADWVRQSAHWPRSAATQFSQTINQNDPSRFLMDDGLQYVIGGAACRIGHWRRVRHKSPRKSLHARANQRRPEKRNDSKQLRPADRDPRQRLQQKQT